MSIAVNLAARDLLDRDLARSVDSMLRAARLPPSALLLEVTESAMMTDPDRAIEVLDSLQQLGVRLSIDDFGTGYSSLAYLRSMPVRQIKIDRSFVGGLATGDKEDEVIVRSTIELAHGLGLEVVAEGVESAEVLERLVALGCDYAQGYWFSPPLPGDEFVRWLDRRVADAATGLAAGDRPWGAPAR